jgi:hypothetical protein
MAGERAVASQLQSQSQLHMSDPAPSPGAAARRARAHRRQLRSDASWLLSYTLRTLVDGEHFAAVVSLRYTSDEQEDADVREFRINIFGADHINGAFQYGCVTADDGTILGDPDPFDVPGVPDWEFPQEDGYPKIVAWRSVDEFVRTALRTCITPPAAWTLQTMSMAFHFATRAADEHCLWENPMSS